MFQWTDHFVFSTGIIFLLFATDLQTAASNGPATNISHSNDAFRPQNRASAYPFFDWFKYFSSSPSANAATEQRHRALKCGHRLKKYHERIVGGQRASIGTFPWMISLQREKGIFSFLKEYYHSCGGSLITESWIVTAAHCMYGKSGPLRAVAGTDNINYLYRAQVRSVERIIIHADFNSDTYNNDIALLKVSQPFNLESTFSQVEPICLEQDVPIYPYDIATICGFGSKAFHQQARSHLYETQIAIISTDVCNASFSNMITENMICAGGMIANRRDACSGDSGGPLQLNYNGHTTLVGVVSFGNDCAVEGFPGIYTRINNYYDWILNNIDEYLYSS